jgi:hypothetical protein
MWRYTVSTLVERLNDPGDHKRLCQGREYLCSCGWDAEVEALLNEAAATITRLEGERDAALKDNKKLRMMMEAREKLQDAFGVDMHQNAADTALEFAQREIDAVARAEAAEATLAEATSATMMAEIRADKLMAEVERLKRVTSVSLLSRLSEAAERERELVEALRPFAVWAERMPDVVPEFARVISKVVQIAIANGHLTGAHFRNAARALQAKEVQTQ